MALKQFSQAELKKLVKFCITGGINTAVDYIVFTVLLKLCGVNVYAAQALGFACGTLNSYIINRSWTFNTSNRFFSRELIKFITVSLVALAASFLAMNRLLLWFPSVDELILKLPIIAITVAINFILSRLWVFK